MLVEPKVTPRKARECADNVIVGDPTEVPDRDTTWVKVGSVSVMVSVPV